MKLGEYTITKQRKDELFLISEKLRREIRQIISDQKATVVVLDDDPTGTQTVHDVPVLTTWEEEVISQQLSEDIHLFFILTNSRGLAENEAREIHLEIGQHLKDGAKRAGRKLIVISRSDSTLRGHYPLEVDALQESLGYAKCLKILAMTFIEGGRFTINDVHYILERNDLIPVSETPFAKDKTFGYQNANLKEYVAEKSNGTIPAQKVNSFSIDELEALSTGQLTKKLDSLSPNSTCVLNAVSYIQLQRFSVALLNTNQPFILRSAASIIPAIAGQPKKDPLRSTEIKVKGDNGSLLIIGSHVPLTSQQLAYLLEQEPEIRPFELDVHQVIKTERTGYLKNLAEEINHSLLNKQDVVMYTSRELVSSNTRFGSLSLAKQISESIVEVVKNLTVKPGYIVAKGGITSSDVATQGLLAKKPYVIGQIHQGIPVWKLDSGSRFPDLNYVVFPGNVGDQQTLHLVYQKLNK